MELLSQAREETGGYGDRTALVKAEELPLVLAQ